MSKRVLAMALAILAFFIFVGSPFGQSAQAFVGVDDAIIAIVIAALAAMGITLYTTEAYTTLNDYVGSLMNEFAGLHDTTIENQLRGAQSGTDKYGRILINNRFLVYIEAFASWLVSKFSIQNGQTTVLNPIYAIGSYNLYRFNTWYNASRNSEEAEYLYINYAPENIGNPVYYVCFLDTSINVVNLVALSSVSFSGRYSIQLSNTTSNVDSGSYGSFSSYNRYVGFDLPYYIYITNFNNYYPAGASIFSGTSREFAQFLQSSSITEDGSVRVIAGNITLPSDDTNYIPGDGAVIDVGADWGDSYSEVTGTVIPGEFSDGLEGDATIDYQVEEEVQEQVEDTAASSISQEVTDYQSPGLQSVFPFCIPFDIYAFFECLAAEPEAPAFTWRFYIPGICDEEIEIDLAVFDSAARILRTMELLLFIVGLAFVTRDKFLRG